MLQEDERCCWFYSCLWFIGIRKIREDRHWGEFFSQLCKFQLGVLSEELSKNINDNLFSKKDERIDIFDDFGKLIQLNYNAAGVSGSEFLLENSTIDINKDYGIILRFAQLLTEDIYMLRYWIIKVWSTWTGIIFIIHPMIIGQSSVDSQFFCLQSISTL